MGRGSTSANQRGKTARAKMPVIHRGVPAPQVNPDETANSARDRQRKIMADFCRMLEVEMTGKPARPAKNEISNRINMPLIEQLSPRVRQTLERLLAGDAEKEIAARLNVSRHTVHVYVKNIYRIFQVCSRGELLAKFVDHPKSAGGENITHP